LKVLEGWEDSHRKVKELAKERIFLKAKLETFMETSTTVAAE
jgi:hypothetical protein